MKVGWSGEIIGLARDGPIGCQDLLADTVKDDGRDVCITRDVKLRRNECRARALLQNDFQLCSKARDEWQMQRGLAQDFKQPSRP